MLNTEVLQVSLGRTQKMGVTKSGRLITWEVCVQHSLRNMKPAPWIMYVNMPGWLSTYTNVCKYAMIDEVSNVFELVGVFFKWFIIAGSLSGVWWGQSARCSGADAASVHFTFPGGSVWCQYQICVLWRSVHNLHDRLVGCSSLFQPRSQRQQEKIMWLFLFFYELDVCYICAESSISCVFHTIFFIFRQRHHYDVWQWE